MKYTLSVLFVLLSFSSFAQYAPVQGTRGYFRDSIYVSGRWYDVLIDSAGWGTIRASNIVYVDSNQLKTIFGSVNVNNNWKLLNTFDTMGVNTQLPLTPSWKFFPWIHGGYRLAVGLQNGASLRKQFVFGSGGSFMAIGRYGGSAASAHSAGFAWGDRANSDNEFFYGLSSNNKIGFLTYYSDSTIAETAVRRDLLSYDSIGNFTFLQPTGVARNYGIYKYYGNLHSSFDDSTLIDKSFGDSAYVKISGTQTIAGVKTFTSALTMPYPQYNSAAPTISAGSGLGTGASIINVTGTSVNGSFELNAGTGIGTGFNNDILTFTFTNPLPSLPHNVKIYRNGIGAGTMGATAFYYDRAASTTTTLVIRNQTNLSSISGISGFLLGYEIYL